MCRVNQQPGQSDLGCFFSRTDGSRCHRPYLQFLSLRPGFPYRIKVANPVKITRENGHKYNEIKVPIVAEFECFIRPSLTWIIPNC